MPELNTRAGCVDPSSVPSVSSNGCQVAASMRPYSGSPGTGTPWDTKVDESTTGGFTGAPAVRSGRPAVTTSVAGERSSMRSEVTRRTLLAGRPRAHRWADPRMRARSSTSARASPPRQVGSGAMDATSQPSGHDQTPAPHDPGTAAAPA